MDATTYTLHHCKYVSSHVALWLWFVLCAGHCLCELGDSSMHTTFVAATRTSSALPQPQGRASVHSPALFSAPSSTSADRERVPGNYLAPQFFQVCPLPLLEARKTDSTSHVDITTLRAEETVAEQHISFMICQSEG